MASKRILIIEATPLFAGGLAAALGSRADWEIATGRAADPADAWIRPGGGAGHEIAIVGAQGGRAELAAGTSPARLRAAVAAVLEGLSVREAPWPEAAPDHDPLTPREIEVFELLGKGLSNREIAALLEISAHTAKFHVGQILAKLGVATRAEAVGEGLRQGLIGL